MSNNALTLAFLALFPSSALAAARISFSISTESPELRVNAHVTDPRGVKAGHLEDGTPTTTNLGGGYGVDRIDDDVDGSAGHASMEINVFGGIYVGTYTVTLRGLADTDYFLNIDYDPNPGRSVVSQQTGFIGSGATRTYFMVVADPNQPPVLHKDVTFSTLRQDLVTASRTRQAPPGDESKFQIGDAKFVAKLDKILAEGERALSKKGKGHNGGKEEAVEKLREFIKKLEKAAKGKNDDDEHEKPGHRHGKEEKRFVSAQALTSLRGDALALIAQLEPRHHHDDGKKHDHDKKGDDRRGGKEHDR